MSQVLAGYRTQPIRRDDGPSTQDQGGAAGGAGTEETGASGSGPTAGGPSGRTPNEKRNTIKRPFRLLAVLLGAVLLGSLVIAVTAGATPTRTPTPVTNIPVFVYHELNNGCAATTAVCNGTDPESVSTAQMTAQLAYMHAQGYRTINLTQYIAWGCRQTAGLPPKPFLITYDNGIGNLLQGPFPSCKRTVTLPWRSSSPGSLTVPPVFACRPRRG